MAPWPRTLLACLLVSACSLPQPTAMPPLATAPGHATAGSATVYFTFSPLTTQALAKTLADVHRYEVTLYDAGGQKVTASGLTNPLMITAPATSGSFTNVPSGTGYYLAVEAFDATDASITQGGPVTSSNTVNVAGATVTYSSGTAVTFALKLLDATPGTGTGTVTLNNAATRLAGADRYGLALVNPVSRRATVSPAGASSQYNLTGVQTGNRDEIMPTHDLWVYVANSVAGTAAPARSTNAYPPDASGEIAATLTYNLGGIELSTISGTSHTAISGIWADETHNLYYATSTGIHRCGSEGGGNTVVVPYTPTPAGWCADLQGNVYLANGTGIVRHAAGAYATATPVVQATNVGRIVADEERNLYWHDRANGTILKAACISTGYGTPITVATGIGAVALLAVNAVGDVFYASGPDATSLADVYKAPLSLDHTKYGAPTKMVDAGGLTSLAVDRAGNVYFTDKDNPYVWMVGAGNAPNLIYKVAGNGNGTTGGANLSGVPTGTNEIVAPANVAVSIEGRLFFSSQAGPAAHEIRRIF